MLNKHVQAQQLITLFNAYYKAKYGVDYKGNTHADKWGFVDMLTDLEWERSVEVVEYYFKTSPRSGHTRQHLCYHYHEYDRALEEWQEERERRRKILQRMKDEYEG